MVDEADPLDRGSSVDHLSDHAGGHGSSRGQNFPGVAFWEINISHATVNRATAGS